MKLGKLLEMFEYCSASISITGLCEEYREGLNRLVQEDCYPKYRDRQVKSICILGGGVEESELYIQLEK